MARYKILKINGTKIEHLDGDKVRENLTHELGFSRKDRNENIKRVGFVADLLSRNGVAVIASFISPYSQQRKELNKNVHNYIEVFVNTPLEVCEQRDSKGLYKKARSGEIPFFTGISDPYEKPLNPHIKISTNQKTSEECSEEIIKYLNENKFVEFYR